MRAESGSIFQKLIHNADQGRRKFASLYDVHGLAGALRRIWKNILFSETVCRLEKELNLPDMRIELGIPLNIEVMGMGFNLENWSGRNEIQAIRGEYGIEQFKSRLDRGDLCFGAYSSGKFTGFVWLEFPPGVEAGYPLDAPEAYTYDGWVFEAFRGRRILTCLQQAVMKYLRAQHPNIRKLVTHVATWNKASLAGDQRAGYVIRRLEKTIVFLGIHTRRVVDQKVPADLVINHG